jgi:hypothetical protein
VVGCVGLVPDVHAVPQKWRNGDAVAVLRGPGTSLLLAEEARLIRTIWQAAPGLSLVHDVGLAGAAAAIAEMAAWSGADADVDDPGENVRFVLSCALDAVPGWAEQIGTVG